MKRLENETFEDYKIRRKNTQMEIKKKLRGKWFWKSKYIPPMEELFPEIRNPLGQSNGTYIKTS